MVFINLKDNEKPIFNYYNCRYSINHTQHFFFFWEKLKMGAFMVILHPRAGSQYRDQLNEAQPSTV